MSSASRFLGLGAALGLLAGLLLGVGLTQAGHARASTPTVPTAAPAIGATAVGGEAVPATGRTTGAASGSATSAPSIAYPCFGGTPGIAPDHTIVVTGVGEAEIASDGSDRTSAEKDAITSALTDAKAQADAIAATTGRSISGVLSVSASVSPAYGVVPMTGPAKGSASATPAPPAGSIASGAPVTTLPEPVVPPIYPQTLGVSVTVEYAIH